MVKSDGISQGTDGQISRHVFNFSRHERACRHVKIGPALGYDLRSIKDHMM